MTAPTGSPNWPSMYKPGRRRTSAQTARDNGWTVGTVLTADCGMRAHRVRIVGIGTAHVVVDDGTHIRPMSFAYQKNWQVEG